MTDSRMSSIKRKNSGFFFFFLSDLNINKLAKYSGRNIIKLLNPWWKCTVYFSPSARVWLNRLDTWLNMEICCLRYLRQSPWNTLCKCYSTVFASLTTTAQREFHMPCNRFTQHFSFSLSYYHVCTHSLRPSRARQQEELTRAEKQIWNSQQVDV